MQNKSLYSPPKTRSYELTPQMPLAGSTDVILSDNTDHNFNGDNNQSDWLTHQKEEGEDTYWE